MVIEEALCAGGGGNGELTFVTMRFTRHFEACMHYRGVGTECGACQSFSK